MFHPPSLPGNLSIRMDCVPILSGKQNKTPFTLTSIGQVFSLPLSRSLGQRRLLSLFPTRNLNSVLLEQQRGAGAQRASAPSRSQRLAAAASAPELWPGPHGGPGPRTHLHHIREWATCDDRHRTEPLTTGGSCGLRRLGLFCSPGLFRSKCTSLAASLQSCP